MMKTNKIQMRKLYSFVFVLVHCSISLCEVVDGHNSRSIFLQQCQRDCAINTNIMACGKYIVVKWINNVVQKKEYVYGSFKIIKIPAIQNMQFLPEVPRMIKTNVSDTLHFIREAAEDLLTRRAFVYEVEQSIDAQNFTNSLIILDDDELDRVRKSRSFGDKNVSQGNFRIFKKKKNIVLPILILLNLLKLKLLLIPIFLGVHFIKKLLILGYLLLPSIVSHLKICKMIQQQPFPYYHWADPSEYPVEHSNVYGHEDPWNHRNDVPGNTFDNYYTHNVNNPFSYYFQY